MSQIAALEQAINNAPKTVSLGTELEKQIISHSLENREFFLYAYDLIEQSHFDNKTNGIIWAFLKKYYEKYKVVPKRQVLESALAKKGIEYEIPDVDYGSIDYVKEEAFRIIKLQKYERFLLSAILQASETNPDYDKLFEEYKKVLHIQNNMSLGTQYFDVRARMERSSQLWVDRISSGFPTLDMCLPGGGFGRKEAAAIMAPPGVGKSLWLVNFGAKFVQRGLKVLHITREMSEDILGLRYDSCFLNKQSKDVLSDINLSIGQIEGLLGVISEERNKNLLWIKEFPTGGGTITEAQSYLQMLRDRYNFNPDVIIDDYLDLAKSSASYKSSYEEQGSVFKEFRGWMGADNICGITALQTTKEAESLLEPIKMRHVSDSYQKPRILDLLMTINESPNDKMLSKQRLYLAKNRNDRADITLTFKVDKGKMRVTDTGEMYSSEQSTSYVQEAPSQQPVRERFSDADVPF